ncbi:MAG: hypothetical protein Q8K15_02305, partial [Candidatus Omnitrophota bacterium]|nr:hypothetical protein [Candidatus Omnitrophota bacterium]
MLFAKVVLGLPIDGPFDYIVPFDLENKISVGTRAWVNFRNKKEVAYVVGLSDKTRIKKLKEISSLIDVAPVLDGRMLLLTKQLADYYCASWGEVIETALPDELRKGKIKGDGSIFPSRHARESGHLDSRLRGNDNIKLEPSPFIFLQGQNRMPVYLREIKEALAAKQSAIILFSDISAVERAGEIIQKSLGIEAFVVFRKQPKELEIWEKIRQADHCVVVGTRSSIFSPVNNLGLIIIDEEEAQVYKQEQ